MRKAIKWIFVLGVIGVAGWIGWKWYNAQSISVDAFNLVPSDAIYCIATSRPIDSWKEVSNSLAWSHLQKNPYFAELTASANSLDSLIRDNDLLINLVGSRALIVSAHMTGAKQYDFLFLVDLKEAAGIKFLQDYLTGFSASGLSVRKEKYGDNDLIALYDPTDKKTLYLSLPGTNLVASYSRQIITRSLDAFKDDNAIAKETFTKAGDDLTNSGILQLYVNYTMLPKFMGCYSSGTNEYVNAISSALQTTGLTLTLEDELIKATGHTYVNDSVESYLKTLSISGKGPTDIMQIAPQRTAFYLGFGFSSFREFFDNFEKNLQQDVTEYKNYRESLRQVENYLKISLQENFVNWVGDEVALFELQSSGKGLDNETAIALKADNIEKAKKDLAYIEKMIRKKTPVKFKAVDHRGYMINYLSMKGLFKVLLGKFFARYDKPYYTIINNIVLFSNHPQTLQSIIDDYLDKKTLNKSEDFRKFRKEFDDEGSVFVYINTPVLFSTLKKLASASTRSSMETNKEYIVCFRHVGFQLVPEKGRFATMLAEQFVAPDPPAPGPTEIRAGIDSTFQTDTPVEPVENEDLMTLPYIYVQNLNAPSHLGYFADSTIHFRVELKNGFKDGAFTEYHPNGEIKMSGRFRSNKRDGTWRLYDTNGELILKRTYDNDVIKKEKD